MCSAPKIDKISNSLVSLLIQIGGESRRDFVLLAFKWRTLVGDYIADNSRLIKIEDRVAHFAVNNSVILQELIILREKIKLRIKKHIGLDLREMIFFVKTHGNKSSTFNTKR